MTHRSSAAQRILTIAAATTFAMTSACSAGDVESEEALPQEATYQQAPDAEALPATAPGVGAPTEGDSGYSDEEVPPGADAFDMALGSGAEPGMPIGEEGNAPANRATP